MSMTDGPVCPVPIADYPTVAMVHGGGGRASATLIGQMFVEAFDSAPLRVLHDGARIDMAGARLAFATDSHVVQPLVYPGGDIGSLSVHGTVNDLCMCGATPKVLSVGFILEEGLPMETLWQIVQSMASAARAAGVEIVTGDTKVVERGKGDGLFVNTAGIGVVPEGIEIDPRRARPGDVVLLSGDIARHGVAILSVREGLSFETEIVSDCAALVSLTAAILAAGGEAVHVLRDPTRGGVASALNEIATTANVGITLDEAVIPVRPEVRAACELLGLDPLYVANEGKCLAMVAPEVADEVLAAMRADPLGLDAVRVGTVTEEHPGKVVLHTGIGGRRVVGLLTGEPLPRIC